jgi:signal transduction histidine kinase
VHVAIFAQSGDRLASSSPTATAPPTAESRTSGPHREVAVAKCGAVVVASVSDRLVSLTTRALGRALLIAAIPLLIIATLISRRLIRRALAPLGEIGQRARNATVDSGVFTLGPQFGLHELDELVDSFDRLLGRLGTAVQAERRFSRDASHELKTPLTVIRGELELLRVRQDLSPDVHSAMGRVAVQV